MEKFPMFKVIKEIPNTEYAVGTIIDAHKIFRGYVYRGEDTVIEIEMFMWFKCKEGLCEKKLKQKDILELIKGDYIERHYETKKRKLII